MPFLPLSGARPNRAAGPNARKLAPHRALAAFNRGPPRYSTANATRLLSGAKVHHARTAACVTLEATSRTGAARRSVQSAVCGPGAVFCIQGNVVRRVLMASERDSSRDARGVREPATGAAADAKLRRSQLAVALAATRREFALEARRPRRAPHRHTTPPRWTTCDALAGSGAPTSRPLVVARSAAPSAAPCASTRHRSMILFEGTSAAGRAIRQCRAPLWDLQRSSAQCASSRLRDSTPP